jgi:hypothetical protein
MLPINTSTFFGVDCDPSFASGNQPTRVNTIGSVIANNKSTVPFEMEGYHSVEASGYIISTNYDNHISCGNVSWQKAVAMDSCIPLHYESQDAAFSYALTQYGTRSIGGITYSKITMSYYQDSNCSVVPSSTTATDQTIATSVFHSLFGDGGNSITCNSGVCYYWIPTTNCTAGNSLSQSDSIPFEGDYVSN